LVDNYSHKRNCYIRCMQHGSNQNIMCTRTEFVVPRPFSVYSMQMSFFKTRSSLCSHSSSPSQLQSPSPLSLDGCFTVHRSITLIDFQLDAQNLYLFIYNTFIKILYMFRALPCSSSRGLRRNCIYAASGIVNLCR